MHRPLYLDVEDASDRVIYKRGGRTRKLKQKIPFEYGILSTPVAKEADDKGLRPEHGDYRIEREVTTNRPVNFKPEAVSHIGYHVDLGERKLGSSIFRFHGGPKHSAQIASRGIADLVNLASEHNKPVKFSIQLHPSHKDYAKFLKSGNHKDIKDFKKSLLGQLGAELGRRGHLPHEAEKISNDVIGGMKVALGHPESTPSLGLKKAELDPVLKSTAFSEDSADFLVLLKLTEMVGIDENIITHSTPLRNVSKILAQGVVKRGDNQGPSFSKYPQFVFGDDFPYIAFHRKNIEKNHKLYRPSYHTFTYGKGVEYAHFGRSGRVHTVKSSNDMFRRMRERGLRPENNVFAAERELTTDRPVEFTIDDVSHLGHHIVVDPDGLDDSNVRNTARTIAGLHNVGSVFKKPLKLSIEVSPFKTKGYSQFLTDGDHPAIGNFKDKLSKSLETELMAVGHSPSTSQSVSKELIGGMKKALGTSSSTHHLRTGKNVHPELRRSIRSESFKFSTEQLIQMKLDEHDLAEFARKAPKKNLEVLSKGLRLGLQMAKKKKELEKKSTGIKSKEKKSF